ncbi:hypothetical protein [Mesorhizobium muleiense]|uniref:Uncharacterized protein n=1 Tax=Mesorhizobium muleiense TaxID=1004279 RepID=A0A1G8SPK5_9HYPH|nr:hypothetical protein [Mesorhizobium muleiense]SDJ31196.1 hypothetical protein SAMN05428953_105283 [Mesorhizobium muleiense]
MTRSHDRIDRDPFQIGYLKNAVGEGSDGIDNDGHNEIRHRHRAASAAPFDGDG